MTAVAPSIPQPRSLVQRHPLRAFFGLTFALSWSLWGLQSLLAGTDPISARWLGIIAVYGPTLTAIALAGLLGPERQPIAWPRRRIWLAGAVLAATVVLNVTVASNPLRSTRPLVAALLWLAITLLPAFVVWNDTMDKQLPAHKRDLSISLLRANLMTLLIGIPIALAQLSLFVLLRGEIQVNVTLWGGMLFFAVLIVSVVAHELIHGLAWQGFGGASDASVSYGFQWSTLTPYAHLRGPVEVTTYRIGGLMPGLILGILPYLLSLALANTPLLVFSVIHTLAAGGDWLILWSLRTLPSGTRVEDHPTRAGCFVLEPEGKQSK